MRKFVASLTRKKQLRMNRKMITLTFFELYIVYVKIRTTVFPYLLVNLFKAYVCYFLSNFYFSPNDSPSKTMKSFFYFI